MTVIKPNPSRLPGETLLQPVSGNYTLGVNKAFGDALFCPNQLPGSDSNPAPPLFKWVVGLMERNVVGSPFPFYPLAERLHVPPDRTPSQPRLGRLAASERRETGLE